MSANPLLSRAVMVKTWDGAVALAGVAAAIAGGWGAVPPSGQVLAWIQPVPMLAVSVTHT
jgi:hypothetical protein